MVNGMVNNAGGVEATASRVAANGRYAPEEPKASGSCETRPRKSAWTRAIYLADGLLRIHGTNDPSSIGTNASSGCFRMYREDVEELYNLVQPGTQVIVQR